MTTKIDVKKHIGKTYSCLTVLKEVKSSLYGTRVLVKCECKTECVKRLSAILNGHIKSCGCIRKKIAKTSGRRKIKKQQERVNSLINTKINDILILDVSRKDKDYFANCICHCKRQFEVRLRNLEGGLTKSCGCLKTRKIDMLNKKYGKLTVKKEGPGKRDSKGNLKRTVICDCDCGTKNFETRASNVRSKITQSCGCTRQKVRKNLIGKEFGYLTVIADAPSYRTPSGKYYRQVICRCECGTERTFKITRLESGRTKSCGCKGGANYISAQEIHSNQYGGAYEQVKKGDIVNGIELLERFTIKKEKYKDCRGKFKCICGKIFEARVTDVRAGRKKSCGCLPPEKYETGQSIKNCIVIDRPRLPNRRKIYTLKCLTCNFQFYVINPAKFRDARIQNLCPNGCNADHSQKDSIMAGITLEQLKAAIREIVREELTAHTTPHSDFSEEVVKASKSKKKSATRKRPLYTDTDRETVIKMYTNGASDEEIGKAINRNSGSISVYIATLRKKGFEIPYRDEIKTKLALKKLKENATHVPIVTKTKKKKQGVSLKVKS